MVRSEGLRTSTADEYPIRCVVNHGGMALPKRMNMAYSIIVRNDAVDLPPSYVIDTLMLTILRGAYLTPWLIRIKQPERGTGRWLTPSVPVG